MLTQSINTTLTITGYRLKITKLQNKTASLIKLTTLILQQKRSISIFLSHTSKFIIKNIIRIEYGYILKQESSSLLTIVILIITYSERAA